MVIGCDGNCATTFDLDAFPRRSHHPDGARGRDDRLAISSAYNPTDYELTFALDFSFVDQALRLVFDELGDTRLYEFDAPV